MDVFIISFIISLIAGFIIGVIAVIARKLIPGRVLDGIPGDIVLGIAGSFAGGVLQGVIEHHFHPADLIGQFIGVVVVLRQARLEPGRRCGLAGRGAASDAPGDGGRRSLRVACSRRARPRESGAR